MNEKIIERNDYLNKLIVRKGNGLIKIITGIRRCGKSYMLNNLFYNHLIASGVKENHIIALDGRRLYLRSAHKALNLYLQSAGAIYMKHLLCHIDDQLRAKYTHGKEFGYVANIHRICGYKTLWIAGNPDRLKTKAISRKVYLWIKN